MALRDMHADQPPRGFARGAQPALPEGVAWATAGAAILRDRGATDDPAMGENGGSSAIFHA
eukprot:2833582-Pyramimonas_sp.AAC.1